MVVHEQAAIDDNPLRLEETDQPRVGPGEVLVRVEACAICRTDLHVVEGDLPPVKMPVIPGHQVVGLVAEAGDGVSRFRPGYRVGIAWLGSTDGICPFCLRGDEKLCPSATFTGSTAHGGYAEYAIVREEFAYSIPEGLEPDAAAPLLCAGRSHRTLTTSWLRRPM